MKTFLRIVLVLILAILPVLACVMGPSGSTGEWWSGQGPVIPHQQFPADCALCHTTKNWQTLKPDFKYDHLAETGVELVGAHAQAQCLRCHNDRGPVQNFAALGCGGCHEDRHEGRLGAECQDCHGEETWQPIGAIAEHGRTRFPLIGIHAAVTCDRCHPGIGSGVFDVLSPECSGCHQADLARATSPDHASQGWVDQCDRCHLPTTWSGAGFRHDGFRLTGAHAVANCEACHVGGQYSGLGNQCQDCHMDSYNSALDPDHPGLGFPVSCDRCHNTSQWQPADFDHGWVGGSCVDCHLTEYLATTDPDHSALGYSQSCQDCHSTNAWRPAGFDHSGINSGCVDCHLSEYNNTNDPDHAALGYPQTCEDCHSTNAWRPAGFDHAGISSGCVDCHMSEYNNTNDPNHAAAGFPTQCEFCHNTNTWDGATFDHDFPIDSGDHKNFDCTDCHLTPGNYAAFSCTHCHDHRQSEMDDEHNGVSGYVWESSACYSCHPDGKD